MTTLGDKVKEIIDAAEVRGWSVTSIDVVVPWGVRLRRSDGMDVEIRGDNGYNDPLEVVNALPMRVAP
ncbi:MAG TPA: hypothetical protein VLA89_11555 [Gemmatimonadales bacterium]|nr:hypothetical protein [Gemmatimonadales bacterium]